MQNQLNQLTEVTELWKRVLGDPPLSQQFAVWLELYGYETVRHGITKAGLKNLQLKGAMSQDHRIRFAAKVMLSKVFDKQKAEGQRPRTVTGTSVSTEKRIMSERQDSAVSIEGSAANA